MEDKPLENRCKIEFQCLDGQSDSCAYKRVDGVDCIYRRLVSTCTSSVANVNAMVLEMKRMGVEFDGIK